MPSRRKGGTTSASKRLGSYARHIERHYVAFQLVTQAEKAGLDGASQMQNRFGVRLGQ